MRNFYNSRKSRHIVRLSALTAATLFGCAPSLADASKTKVTIPSADTTKFAYNGSQQTYTLAANENYTVFGNAHTSAGEYEVTVSLNNSALCEWEDGSVESKIFKFVINKMQIEIPAADDSLFVYNGSQQAYTIPANGNYTAEGFLKTDAGNHEVTVALNDTLNCEWSDATVAEKKYTFAISKATVSLPAADTSKFTYNGAELVYTITPNICYNVTGNAQTKAGIYKVIVSLANANNYQWEDLTCEDKTFSFEISKATIELPTAVKDTFEYDGNLKQFEIVNNELYTLDVTNPVGVEVGDYVRTVTINDVENYMWADNTTEPKVVTFVIKEGVVKVPASAEFTYTGSPIALVPLSEAYTAENGIGENAGDYIVTLKLNPGYIWENGKKEDTTVFAKINPILVEKPVVSTGTVTYDSTVYSMSIPENPAYTITGALMGQDPGVYTTTVLLNPNYAWTDLTTDDQIYNLIIERMKVAIPEPDSTIFYYSQKNQTYSIEESKLYTIAGNIQKEIGSHDVALTLNDTIYYEWADATTKPKHYQFNIIESTGFEYVVVENNDQIVPGEDIEIDLAVDGVLQYYKISSDALPGLKDSLIAFDSETSKIKIPTTTKTLPGKYKMNITLMSGNIEKKLSIDVTINHPASSIIICWNDVIAVDGSKVKSSTYQWYKDGVRIAGATGQYYSDRAGLCGSYSCVVDGDLSVGPVFLDFGKPQYLDAHGEKGRIIASAASSKGGNVMLLSINGEVIDSKPASANMAFTVKPGTYVLMLEGTDISVVVIVR